MKNENITVDYVDKSDRKRLYFYSEITKILIMYESSDKEVNDMIYQLYTLSNSLKDIEPKPKRSFITVETKGDKQFDEDTFIRNVWKDDIIIHSIIASIFENQVWCIEDSLSKITEDLYFKLDKIIHPDYRPGLDYEDVRYYVEVEYIDKEKQEELQKNHNLDFKEEDWRA